MRKVRSRSRAGIGRYGVGLGSLLGKPEVGPRRQIGAQFSARSCADRAGPLSVDPSPSGDGAKSKPRITRKRAQYEWFTAQILHSQHDGVDRPPLPVLPPAVVAPRLAL